MRTLRDVFVHSGAYGARVADEQPTGAAASPLMPADDKTLNWARSFWDESDADDFEWGLGGMKVRHKETGEVFKIKLGDPAGGELQSDVATFCVRDRRLILLARPGSERPTITNSGTYDMVARKLSTDPATPVDGQEIW
jgi:hypothetical protein